MGEDLLALPAQRPPLVVENSDSYPVKYHGLRTERWKYLRRESDGEEQLFDLERDAAETTNLAAEKAELVNKLRAALDDRLGAMAKRALAASEGRPDDPETLEALDALPWD